MKFKINKPVYHQVDEMSIVAGEIIAFNELILMRNDIKRLDFPQGVQKAQEELKLPSGITEVKLNPEFREVNNLLSDSSTLQAIDMYDSQVAEIVINRNKNLKKVILPKSLTILKAHAMANNFALEYVWIPSTIQAVHRHAWALCFKLKKLYTDNKEALTEVLQKSFSESELAKYQIVEVSQIDRL